MAATTISRATITDDSGNGTSGTILNAAWVGTAIYDKIDSIFNNAGLTTWEANVAGVVGVRAANTNTGTSGFAELGAANSSGTLLRLRHFGTGFTTSGANVQDGSTVEGTGAGGLSLFASNAAGVLRFWTNGVQRGSFTVNGHFIVPELAANPAVGDMTANAAVCYYNTNNKLVFAYNNAGTVTYLSIPLNGSSTTWTHSTTAP